MLTASQFDALLTPIEDLYEQYNISVINDIARRLAKMGHVTSSAAWQMQRLIESGKTYDFAIVELAKLMKVDPVYLKQMFDKAGVKSLQFDDRIYSAAGLHPMPMHLSPAMLDVLKAGLNKTNGVVNNLVMTTAQSGQQAFIEAADLAYMQVASGAMSYTQAIRAAVKDTARSGLKVIQYGRHADQIDVAVRRAVLTGVSQTTAQLQLARADELRQDLVITSAHAGARPSHQIWQGHVFSRSGKDSQYPEFESSTGYGTIGGLAGANCRHSFYPFFKGISKEFYDKATLDEYEAKTVPYQGKQVPMYEATQMQRKMEREIRAVKREAGALNAAGLDNGPEVMQVRRLQAQLRAFVRETGLQRQAEREGGRLAKMIGPKPSPSLRQVSQLPSSAQSMSWGSAFTSPSPLSSSSPSLIISSSPPTPTPSLPKTNYKTPPTGAKFRKSPDGTEVITSSRPVPGGHAFEAERVTIKGNGDAILKPNTAGEPWGRFDAVEGFSRHEVAASQLDTALDLGVVPKTTPFIENGEYKSLQRWVDNATSQPAFGSPFIKDDPGKLMLLDLLTGNMDRHGGNWLYETATHRIKGIDNGLGLTFLDGDHWHDHASNLLVSVREKTSRIFERFFQGWSDAGRPFLSTTYRDTLARMLASGDFESIVRAANLDLAPGENAMITKAAVERARTLVNNWSDYFAQP